MSPASPALLPDTFVAAPGAPICHILPGPLLVEAEGEPQEIMFSPGLLLSIHFAPEIMSLIPEAAVALRNVMHAGG